MARERYWYETCFVVAFLRSRTSKVEAGYVVVE